MNFKLLLSIVAVGVFGVSLIGCESERSKLIDKYTKGNAKKLSMLYEGFTGAHAYQGPKDEAELRDWVTGPDFKKDRMAKLNIHADKFDDYLVSDRTGEKFEIRWGVKSVPMGPPRPVIFETTAFEGVRQVGLAGGSTLNVETDEEYDELMSGVYVPDDFDKYPNRRKKRKKKK